MKKFLDVVSANDKRDFAAWSRLARWTRRAALVLNILGFGMMIGEWHAAGAMAFLACGGCYLVVYYAFEQMKLNTAGLERATAALVEYNERR